MLDRIRQLEQQARALELDAVQRAGLMGAVQPYTEEFLTSMERRPVFEDEGAGHGLYDAPIEEQGIAIDEILRLWREQVDRPGLNAASGGHLAYIPGGGLFASAVADFMAAVSNKYAGIYFAAPGAVRMENMLLQWMAELVGYPSSAAGNLTSGGSIANLAAITTARDAAGLRARDFHRAVVYLSGHVHHCVDKALRNAGLGECVRREIPVDDNYRMDAAALAAALKQDAADSSLRPWLVVASAGTTNTGSVDPLGPIAELAQRYKLWYHVDAAYGAFFLLGDYGKKLMQGIEHSDSIVLDPHKGLFLPYGSGALLVRRADDLMRAHHYQADYMQDARRRQDELSPADLSPELTKHFRGLRLWLPLKLFGLAPFRAALEEKLLLSRYFHLQLQKLPGFEVGPAPDLSVVTFRYLPAKGNADHFNERLIDEIRRDGRVFLSSTILDGRFCLRLAVLSFRTHLQTVDLCLAVLREIVGRLEHSTA